MILNKLEEVSNFFRYENFNESVNQGISFFYLLKLNKDTIFPKEILDFVLNDEKTETCIHGFLRFRNWFGNRFLYYYL